MTADPRERVVTVQYEMRTKRDARTGEPWRWKHCFPRWLAESEEAKHHEDPDVKAWIVEENDDSS